MARKKQKPKTKEDLLRDDWLDYNKRAKSSRIPKLTFDEYKAWVYGKRPRKQVQKVEKEPVIAKPSWATTTDHVPSVVSTGVGRVAARNSMVERVVMGQVTGEEADEILRKSQRVGLLTSKGGYGYISDETDLKTLGKKTQQL